MILYTELARRAIADMSRTVQPLRHIDPDHVCVMAANRLSRSRYGNLAQCYALREKLSRDLQYWYNPRNRHIVKITPWVLRKNVSIELGGQAMLYMILLRLPRLLGYNPLETLIHELIHIAPAFDGSLREARHGKRFDRMVHACMREWRRCGDRELVAAMDCDYETLTREYGSLAGSTFGSRFVTPQTRRLEDGPPLESHPDIARGIVHYKKARVLMVNPDYTPDDVPEVLTEKDIAYRIYSPGGAHKISASALKADRRLFPGFPENLG
ncbi:MAG: hypothetical protein ACLFUS_02720 [Candidatus Sumerlaeia bacterium]